jgi:hypothetical protein
LVLPSADKKDIKVIFAVCSTERTSTIVLIQATRRGSDCNSLNLGDRANSLKGIISRQKLAKVNKRRTGHCCWRCGRA